MSKSKEIIERHEIDALTEMGQITPEMSGINWFMWIRPEPNELQHGPRLKVSIIPGRYEKKGQVVFTIPRDVNKESTTIGDTSKIGTKDISRIKEFIIHNHDLLIKIYDEEVKQMDVMKNLKKIK